MAQKPSRTASLAPAASRAISKNTRFRPDTNDTFFTYSMQPMQPRYRGSESIQFNSIQPRTRRAVAAKRRRTGYHGEHARPRALASRALAEGFPSATTNPNACRRPPTASAREFPTGGPARPNLASLVRTNTGAAPQRRPTTPPYHAAHHHRGSRRRRT